MSKFPDPPWMGLDEEDWNEKCSHYGEDYIDYLEDRADREYDQKRAEELYDDED